MLDHELAQTLNVTAKNCPMPEIKANQAIDELSSGEKEGRDVLKHYVRRTE